MSSPKKDLDLIFAQVMSKYAYSYQFSTISNEIMLVYEDLIVSSLTSDVDLSIIKSTVIFLTYSQ